MVYRHTPGPVMRLLSVRGVFTVARASFIIANRVVGRYGNKLALVATREVPD
jgi:hypothetical protein